MHNCSDNTSGCESTAVCDDLGEICSKWMVCCSVLNLFPSRVTTDAEIDFPSNESLLADWTVVKHSAITFLYLFLNLVLIN